MPQTLLKPRSHIFFMRWMTHFLRACFLPAHFASHNLLDKVQSRSWFWSILHVPNVLVRTPGVVVVDVYPLIPWIGVTAVGYGSGQIYRWPTDRRKAFLLRTGLAETAGFIVLRAINLYGDPVRWSSQKSTAFTVLSFLNTTHIRHRCCSC